MARPEDIPQDVWDAALGTYSEKLPDTSIALIGFEAIARAIMARDERAAKIAESADRPGRNTGSLIAAAIRKGGQ